MFDKTTKLFFKIATIGGLTFGLLFGLFVAISEDWQLALGEGILGGFFFGLALAYLHVRPLSKQIHPIEISQISSDATTPEDVDGEIVFPVEMISFRRTLSFQGGGTILLAILLFLGTPTVAEVAQWFILMTFFSLEWIRLLISRNVMYLRLSTEGIVFQNLLSRLAIHWEDVERIEMRGQFWFEQHWYLICKKSELKANAFTKWWTTNLERDRRIPLIQYSNELLKSDISNAIRHFAPKVKFYTTL